MIGFAATHAQYSTGSPVFSDFQSYLSRVAVSRPLVKGNEDAGYEGGIFVMAQNCTEALSKEIFWHTYSTKDVYFSLETLAKLCSILMHLRRSI